MNKYLRWGEAKTINPIEIIDGEEWKICTHCKTKKKVSEFYKRNSYNPIPYSKCIECTKRITLENKRKALEISG